MALMESPTVVAKKEYLNLMRCYISRMTRSQKEPQIHYEGHLKLSSVTSFLRHSLKVLDEDLVFLSFYS